ncbi:MAG: FecR domain-containing protein [Verrucomicrobiota bacterium]|nr:FecR domain-containing protein [Verrucomicrobiota bacterium]
MKFRSFLFLIAFLVLGASASFADSAGAKIGKVTAIKGKVTAIGADKVERVLEKGAFIFLHDLIQVEEDGKAQIYFSDGSLFNLVPSTEFQVDSYERPTLTKEGHFSAQLAKGGLRALSGKIGKKNPENYEVNTPVATIGIRGTLFQIMISEGKVFFGCNSGEIRLSNEGGQLLLGPEAQAEYATVENQLASPVALEEQPGVFRTPLFGDLQGAKPLSQPLAVPAPTEAPAPAPASTEAPAPAPAPAPVKAPAPTSTEAPVPAPTIEQAPAPAPIEAPASVESPTSAPAPSVAPLSTPTMMEENLTIQPVQGCT